jgi:predicted transcriptional regulator
MSEASQPYNLVVLAANVVATDFSNNAVALSDILGGLIARVNMALVASSPGAVEKPVEAQTPAVPIKKSVQADFIVCIEDGKKFKSLKRHLQTNFDVSSEEYRAKWELPADYPMVAPKRCGRPVRARQEHGLGTTAP